MTRKPSASSRKVKIQLQEMLDRSSSLRTNAKNCFQKNLVSQCITNAKNQLQEKLASLGLTTARCAKYASHQKQTGNWESKVTVHVEGFPKFTGTGKGPEKVAAEIEAAKVVLERLTGVVPNWSRTVQDAQAGDVLIKLAAYLAADSAELASRWLQDYESDASLVAVFDRWQAEGVEEFRSYGAGLGHKAKATLVEALIWWRFKARVLRPKASEALEEIVRWLAPRDFSSAGPK